MECAGAADNLLRVDRAQQIPAPADGDRNAELFAVLSAVRRVPTPMLFDTATEVLTGLGWLPCGEGDWAIAHRSPTGGLAARVSPFDPAAEYTIELYRSGIGNRYLPRLVAELPLDGGGSLMIMDFLEAVLPDSAREMHRRLRDPVARRSDPDLAAAAMLIDRVHRRAMVELPWCGPLDDNPGNVMQDRAGQLKFVDLFYLQGLILYDKVLSAPQEVVTAMPADRRRHMFEIPAVRRGTDAETLGRMRSSLEQAESTSGNSV